MRYRILLRDKVEPELLKEIQSKHSGDVEGIDELYDLLIENGTCNGVKVDEFVVKAMKTRWISL